VEQIPPEPRFAQILNRDLDAVRNAIAETASNGQVEGQVNRLKTLKRAMYGRAGVDLLRARLMPIETQPAHRVKKTLINLLPTAAQAGECG
jgi:transposase